MKKYVKPELFFERYELSQHIAACTWDLNSANEEICDTFKGDPTMNPNIDGFILLTTEKNCTFPGPNCYMVAVSSMNIFNS